MEHLPKPPFLKGRFGGNVNITAEAAQKKSSLQTALFSVRIKGLEPPRLSASDPKSDVATNYTISAESLLTHYLSKEGKALQR